MCSCSLLKIFNYDRIDIGDLLHNLCTNRKIINFKNIINMNAKSYTFYVAKVYKHMMPSIVECLTDETRAHTLAKILSEEKKEQYIVLAVL